MKAGHDVSLPFFIACRFEEALKLYIQMTQRIRAAGEAALAKIFCWSGEWGRDQQHKANSSQAKTFPTDGLQRLFFVQPGTRWLQRRPQAAEFLEASRRRHLCHRFMAGNCFAVGGVNRRSSQPNMPPIDVVDTRWQFGVVNFG